MNGRVKGGHHIRVDFSWDYSLRDPASVQALEGGVRWDLNERLYSSTIYM